MWSTVSKVVEKKDSKINKRINFASPHQNYRKYAWFLIHAKKNVLERVIARVQITAYFLSIYHDVFPVRSPESWPHCLC